MSGNQSYQQFFQLLLSNVIYCFVANLTDFPAVKEFWKLVMTGRN